MTQEHGELYGSIKYNHQKYRAIPDINQVTKDIKCYKCTVCGRISGTKENTNLHISGSHPERRIEGLNTAIEEIILKAHLIEENNLQTMDGNQNQENVTQPNNNEIVIREENEMNTRETNNNTPEIVVQEMNSHIESEDRIETVEPRTEENREIGTIEKCLKWVRKYENIQYTETPAITKSNQWKIRKNLTQLYSRINNLREKIFGGKEYTAEEEWICFEGYVYKTTQIINKYIIDQIPMHIRIKKTNEQEDKKEITTESLLKVTKINIQYGSYRYLCVLQ